MLRKAPLVLALLLVAVPVAEAGITTMRHSFEPSEPWLAAGLGWSRDCTRASQGSCSLHFYSDLPTAATFPIPVGTGAQVGVPLGIGVGLRFDFGADNIHGFTNSGVDLLLSSGLLRIEMTGGGTPYNNNEVVATFNGVSTTICQWWQAGGWGTVVVNVGLVSSTVTAYGCTIPNSGTIAGAYGVPEQVTVWAASTTNSWPRHFWYDNIFVSLG